MDCDHVFKYIIMITFGIVIAIIIWLFNNTAAVNVCAAVAPHAFPAKVEGFAHNLPNQLEPHRLYKILDFIVVLYVYFRFRL